jgi:putative flippase GtrA
MAPITKLTDIKEFSDLTQYSLWGFVAFCIGLGSLYVFVGLLYVPYWIAVPLSVCVNLVIHYTASRLFVFTNSDRSIEVGLLIFIAIGIAEIFAITTLVTLLVEYGGANVYWARIGAGIIAALGGFWANGKYNFKVL